MATATQTSEKTTKKIVALLKAAYAAEWETSINYLAHSINLQGVQAEEIKRALAEDVAEEFGHAQKLAERIQQLHGDVPGSLDLKFSQKALQPPQESTDLKSVIRGVIAAEEDAIGQYRDIIQQCEGTDFVTQDLATQLLADEEGHLRLFEGFLADCDQCDK